MEKLKNLIPTKESKKQIKEAIDDLDAPLPGQLTRFLEKTISIIKGYNLPRKKEALVMAKVIDAMGIDKSQFNSILSRVKKSGVLNKEVNLNEGELTSYYNNSSSDAKSTSRKLEDMLKKSVTDKRELSKIIDLITALSYEYAVEYANEIERGKF